MTKGFCCTRFTTKDSITDSWRDRVNHERKQNDNGFCCTGYTTKRHSMINDSWRDWVHNERTQDDNQLPDVLGTPGKTAQ
jgi:hypothetical protein